MGDLAAKCLIPIETMAHRAVSNLLILDLVDGFAFSSLGNIWIVALRLGANHSSTETQ
jgi:hypothetical protein